MSQEKPDVNARKGPPSACMWHWKDIGQHTFLSRWHMSSHTKQWQRTHDDAMLDSGWGLREDWPTEEGGTGQGSKEARCLQQGYCLTRKKAIPSQPRSICPLRWRASLMRSGRRPFRSTDARQPWKPSREATSFGRLLYMPWARPAMYRSPKKESR